LTINSNYDNVKIKRRIKFLETQLIFDFVSQFGFPGGVAVYLLVYLKQETQKNREVLLKLEAAILSLTMIVNGCEKNK